MTLQELGQAIQEKRTAANLSIDDVAGRIKISSRILKSIEEGSLVGLPHAVYTKSFIRSFGLLVGYDPAELTKRLDELFPPESLDETRNEPGPRTRTLQVSSNSGRNIVILLFLIVMLTVLAVGGWYVAKNYGDMILNLVKTPFSAITAPSSDNEQTERRQAVSRFSTPAAPANGSVSSAQAAPVPAASPAIAQSAGMNAQARAPGDSAQTAPAQAPSVTPTAPASAGVAASGPASTAAQTAQTRADGKNSLRIIADQPCWVSFTVDGAKGRDHTLQPREDLTLTYKTSLEVVFGNAGGVSMEHNGRDIGRPGRAGQRAVASFPRSGE